jgi:hypothetical protein
MIRCIILFFPALLLLSSCNEGSTGIKCTDPNCEKPMAAATTEDSKDLSCKLTTPELQKRKTEVIAVLKKKVQEKKELSNGYSFRFDGSDETFGQLTDFVKSERRCCDFFHFSLQVKDTSSIWLDITGPEGSKEFITTEMEL